MNTHNITDTDSFTKTLKPTGMACGIDPPPPCDVTWVPVFDFCHGSDSIKDR